MEKSDIKLFGSLDGTSKRLFLFTLLVAASVLLPFLGAPQFYTRGEAREALVAQDIFTHSHWILPQGYGGSIPSKPPMLHWLVALMALFVGFNEIAARLPSALSSLVFLGLFFVILCRRRSALYATVACLSLLFAFEWLRASVSCRVDMVHVCALVAALLLYFCEQRAGVQGKFQLSSRLLITGLLSISFLAKGPVAVVLAALVFTVWECLHRGKDRLADLCLKVAPLLVWFVLVPCVVAGLWYVLAWWFGGTAFEEKFIEENLARFFGVMKAPAHEHGVLYLVGVLLVGFCPWTMWWVAWLLQSWREGALWSRLKPQSAPDSLNLFSRVAAITVLIFYCIPSSKRGVYLLAAYPFLIILFLDAARPCWRELLLNYWGCQRWLFKLVVLLYLVLAAAWFIDGLAGAPFTSGAWLRYPVFVGHFIRSLNPISSLLFTLPLFICGLSLWGGFAKFRQNYELEIQRGLELLSVLIALFWCVQGVVLPKVAEETSLAAFVGVLKKEVGQQRLASFGSEFYSLSYYSQKKITSRQAPFFDGDWVVLERKKLERFEKELTPGQSLEIVAEGLPGIKPGAEPLLVRVSMKQSQTDQSDVTRHQKNAAVGQVPQRY